MLTLGTRGSSVFVGIMGARKDVRQEKWGGGATWHARMKNLWNSCPAVVTNLNEHESDVLFHLI